MATKMLRFVDVAQATPPKRAAGTRRTDFLEIYQEFATEAAADQSGRCEQCGIPFCQIHCPLQNNIPDWLMLTAEGRLEEAYQVSSATNSMPEICGRICPQDRLCEGSCVLEQSNHGSVTIGAVEKYITDTAWQQGWVKPIRPKVVRDQTVGIIGAGPAGLAAAEQLRRMGYGVDVYDRYDRIGGLLIYGIPNFKLEKEVVIRRVDWLTDGGIRFHPNTEIGTDVAFGDLRTRHHALLIGTGVYRARALQVPGAGLGGVHRALDYLTASNRVGLGDDVPAYADGTLNARGKDVVVIGGGDTAMDCVRTAIRQGAKSVTCLYRRDQANMPGSQREVMNAQEEGIRFEWLSAPEALLGDDANRVRGVRAVRMHLGIADASGRRVPTAIEGSQFIQPADMVIEALGFEPEDLPGMFNEPGLRVSSAGTLTVDPRTQMTAVDGVFAAGDIVRGASLVVWAIRDGRDAAAQIHAHIQRALRRDGADAAPALARAS